MKEVFIAELHDIGKLVDDQVKKQVQQKIGKSWTGHVFTNLSDDDFKKLGISKPTSPSWWGQYHHEISENYTNIDINNWKEIPDKIRPDLFLLVLADHLASSVSRALPQIGSAGQSEGVLKLWNEEFYEKEKNKGKSWAVFKTEEDLREMFDLFDTINSPDELLERYKENLILTPEDKSKPRNITSLYTHIELVGKIYRVLKKHVDVKITNANIILELCGQKVKTINESEGGNRTTGNQNVHKALWQARFLKCWIKFSNSFVRLQDINLLVKRQELLESLTKKYKDYVMFSLPDFIALFLPIGMDIAEIFEEFLQEGFLIEYVETIADFGILSSNIDRKTFKAREENDTSRLVVLNNRDTKVNRRVLMPEYPEQIFPPICDICQRAHATERIKENIREWICDRCFEIREMGEGFKYPEEWIYSKVAWFKFNLDQNKLEKWLQDAFNNYIDSLPQLRNKLLKDEFRPIACQYDFVKDYLEMIKIFWNRCEDLKIAKPVSDYNELGVFKFSGQTILAFIKKFLEIYDEYFPNCEGGDDSPISLSISISNIKYPLREHWKYINNPKGFINIKMQDIFEIVYAKRELNILLEIQTEIKKTSSHFLYALNEKYKKLESEVYIMAEIFNNKNKHPLIYEIFKNGISIQKILNFYRLVEEENEVT